jgi:zinc-ribbon domain
MATTITITCPHCGLAREVPTERIPAGSARVTCPQCRESFMFVKPGESPQRNAAQSSGETPQPAGWGTPKTTVPPASSIRPDPIRALLRKKNLSRIGALFSNAWTIYKRRVWTLLSLDLIVLIPMLLLFGSIYFVHLLFPDLRTVTPLLAGVVIAGLIAVLIASLWGQTALVFAVTDDALTSREALEKGWHRLGTFAWLSLLMGFIVMGGFWLLIVPGLIFLVWFFFGQFFLAGDDERGMNALLKSKAYVKGHFFAVLLRLFVVWLIGVALGMLPLIGPILSALFVPFAMIFAFLVYRELREIKGDISFPSSAGEKGKWLGAGLLGYAIIPIILFAFLGTTLLSLKR